MLGCRGNVLEQSIAYMRFFSRRRLALADEYQWREFWRGTGNMKAPSLMMLSSAVLSEIILAARSALGLARSPIRHALRRRRFR